MGGQIVEDQWASPFSLSIWTCIKSDGSVPSGMAGASHWIFLEGSVKEIPLWNGKRLVILGKAPFSKKFSPVRVFDKLIANIKINKLIEEKEVIEMLEEIGKTDEIVRNDVSQNYKNWKPK